MVDLVIGFAEGYPPGEFESLASLSGMQERTIISDGASKIWAMTGWRIGYIANRTLAPVFTRWITNTDSCASQISQWAALEAINGPQDSAQAMCASFLERRDLIIGLLNAVPGISCKTPGGAFYAFPQVPAGGPPADHGGVPRLPPAVRANDREQAEERDHRDRVPEDQERSRSLDRELVEILLRQVVRDRRESVRGPTVLASNGANRGGPKSHRLETPPSGASFADCTGLRLEVNVGPGAGAKLTHPLSASLAADFLAVGSQ